MGKPSKYTKEFLAPLVRDSFSVMEVMRRAGLRTFSGGAHNQITGYIDKYGLDTSHFTGRATNVGTKHRGGAEKLAAVDILVNRRTGRREPAHRLRRALKECGVAYRCCWCKQDPQWNGKPLTLQVDHVNGDNLDNRRHNLRFLCPNCHSQTETFGRSGDETR